MKRIGLLSDTHSFWDPKYLEYFEECDEIWHAGDIGSMEVVQKLSAFRPFRAVYGNCDGGDIRKMFGEKLRWRCEDAEVLMTHIGGYPGKYAPGIRTQLYNRPPHLFICGHSHILKVQFDPKLGLLHINPGAAGIMGWHKVRTLVRFTVEGQAFKDLEVIEIPRTESSSGIV